MGIGQLLVFLVLLFEGFVLAGDQAAQFYDLTFEFDFLLDFFGQSFLNFCNKVLFGLVEVLLDLFEFFFRLFFQLHDKNVFVFDDSFELIDFFGELMDFKFHFVFLVFEFV